MSGLSRGDFEAFWDKIEARAQGNKLGEETTHRLTRYYENLERSDREVVNSSLAEWVVGNNLQRKFDAEALIRVFKIRSALPAVYAQLRLVEDAEEPALEFYRKRKLERIIAELEGSP